jgi:hypothetical protein
MDMWNLMNAFVTRLVKRSNTKQILCNYSDIGVFCRIV